MLDVQQSVSADMRIQEQGHGCGGTPLAAMDASLPSWSKALLVALFERVGPVVAFARRSDFERCGLDELRKTDAGIR
ncbi:MAG: hypothetical protein OSA97_10775 [Nevskia sp.]|nr:hypothetical protein [Nevskia sp.]